MRGLAIVLMVFYHAFYILGYQFGVPFMQQTQAFFQPLQPLFACLFILISGIASNLSHSNLVRGARLAAIALGFTAVTVILLPKFGIEGAEIYFGILHLLSFCMLLFAALKKPLSSLPTIPSAVVSLLLFALCYYIPSGKILAWDLPQGLYSGPISAVFGFPNAEFYSADYFPILPYVFMFLAGTFLGRLAADGSFPKAFYVSRVPLLGAIGKRTLLIYLLHWPIIFLLGLLISKF